MQKKIRPIAINLPQFYPIPENDLWWGKGFTEWTNVTKAQPLYDGHYQPQLPADLGFYDLRLADSRKAQADMAKQYGFYGFCYYHYWFNGKRLLERPVDEILTTGQPDFPFMLCWANDNWTRRWDGLDKEVLLSHEYSADDDIAHIKHLIKYFKDPRYIRVDNKPVFILYKPFLLPDPEATALRWREVAAQYGIDLYLCHMVFGYSPQWNLLLKGFDATIDFEPFGVRRFVHPKYSNKILGINRKLSMPERIRNKFVKNKKLQSDKKLLNVYDYKSMYENLLPLSGIGYKIYPSIVPGWDNSPRRRDDPSMILDESTPQLFGNWVEKVINDFKPYSADENFIFINAWNEWAEGNHLEPCQKWGRQYLDVLKKELEKVSAESDE